MSGCRVRSRASEEVGRGRVRGRGGGSGLLLHSPSASSEIMCGGGGGRGEVGGASRWVSMKADRDWGIAHDPFTGFMNVAACGQVHKGVCAPDGGPLQLLYLLHTHSTSCRSDISMHVPMSFRQMLGKAETQT